MIDAYATDWSKIAFSKSGKRLLKSLDAVFIAAPREMSAARFKALIKRYLPTHNIILGIAKEPFVEGFEDQPQFRTLRAPDMAPIIELVNSKSGEAGKHIYTLHYFQRELPFILDGLSFHRVLLVRGSWKYVFHNSSSYYTLTSQQQPFEFISPFLDLAEARAYEARIDTELIAWLEHSMPQGFSEKDMLELANKAARLSYDYSFQTGAILGKKTTPKSKKYSFLAGGVNRVVPFQTYAMLYGASREENFSPAHDLNHYDTIHAEVDLVLTAQRLNINLQDTCLFINLLPCPSCARMFTRTGITEFVYSIDHSDGYAVKMLEAAGKKVRRVVL